MPLDNPEVWLNTYLEPKMATVVPYVRVAKDASLAYRVVVEKEGAAGSSNIVQSGTATVAAREPRALSSVAIDRNPVARCVVNVELRDAEGSLTTYEFRCPR